MYAPAGELFRVQWSSVSANIVTVLCIVICVWHLQLQLGKLAPHIIHEAYYCVTWLAHSQKCIHARCFVQCYREHITRIKSVPSDAVCDLHAHVIATVIFCTIHTLNTLSTRTDIVNLQEVPWCDCTKQIMVLGGFWATVSIIGIADDKYYLMKTDAFDTALQTSRISVVRLAQNRACLRHQHDMPTNCCLFLPVITMTDEICNMPRSMTEFYEVVPSWGTWWRIDPTTVRFRCEVWFISTDANCLHDMLTALIHDVS